MCDIDNYALELIQKLNNSLKTAKKLFELEKQKWAENESFTTNL